MSTSGLHMYVQMCPQIQMLILDSKAPVIFSGGQHSMLSLSATKEEETP